MIITATTGIRIVEAQKPNVSPAIAQKIETAFGSAANEIITHMDGISFGGEKKLVSEFAEVLVSKFKYMPKAAHNITETAMWESTELRGREVERYLSIVSDDKVVSSLKRLSGLGKEVESAISLEIASTGSEIAKNKKPSKSMDMVLEGLNDRNFLSTLDYFKDKPDSIADAVSIITNAIKYGPNVVEKVSGILLSVGDSPNTLHKLYDDDIETESLAWHVASDLDLRKRKSAVIPIRK